MNRFREKNKDKHFGKTQLVQNIVFQVLLDSFLHGK